MPGERSTKKRAHGVHLGPIPEFFWQAGISSHSHTRKGYRAYGDVLRFTPAHVFFPVVPTEGKRTKQYVLLCLELVELCGI